MTFERMRNRRLGMNKVSHYYVSGCVRSTDLAIVHHRLQTAQQSLSLLLDLVYFLRLNFSGGDLFLFEPVGRGTCALASIPLAVRLQIVFLMSELVGRILFC